MTWFKSIWLPPVLTALINSIGAILFFWGRDFGAFLFALFLYIPAIILISIILFATLLFLRQPRLKLMVGASLGAVIVPPALILLAAHYGHDRISFELWYPTHRQIVEATSHTDRIILTWDDWGMAGSANFTYLVSNPDDNIRNIEDASRWTRAHHMECPVVDVQRMRRGLYIFSTYNCPLQ